MLNPRVKAARVALYTVVLASLCTTGFMLPFAKAHKASRKTSSRKVPSSFLSSTKFNAGTTGTPL